MSLARRMLCVVCVAALGSAHAAVHIDDAARSVQFDRVPQRTVTLAPNLTELVYAVGAGSTLVGTVDTSNYPAAAMRVPRIGDAQRLDVERILTLEPDVVLVWLHGNQGRELQQLESAGIKLFYVEPRRLDDVASSLIKVGALLGHDAQGRAAATQLRRGIDVLRQRYASAAPVSVFFQVWTEPLMTLNNQHLISDLVALCGGRNVFGDAPALAPQISAESVVARNPDAMLTAGPWSPSMPLWQREPENPAFRMWQRFNHLTAVKRRWTYVVPGDLVTRQGPRILEGARAVCGALDQVRAERNTATKP